MLQPLDATVERLRALAPASTSYEMAGRALRFGRSLPLLEPIRRAGMPDYISNYFPLADAPLVLGEARVVRHDLRVPMVPFERTKFAWSNYDGEVQLFLHTDPELIDAVRMAAAFEAASAEVLEAFAAAHDEGRGRQTRTAMGLTGIAIEAAREKRARGHPSGRSSVSC